MPWQKIERYISDDRIVVESKSGKTYPVRVEYDWLGEGIYSQMVNTAHDDREFWAWVNFDGDGDAVVEDYVKQNEGDGYPGAPPWERGS